MNSYDFLNDCYENESFDGIVLEPCELSGKKFIKCSFDSADFSQATRIYKCTFENCSFVSAVFNGIDLKSCAFLNCKFKFGKFFSTKFDGCKMTGSSFIYAECSFLDIVGGDWSYTYLADIDFSKQKINGVRFFGADLTNVCFEKCTVTDCDFTGATINGMSFKNADIRGCCLSETNVLTVNFSGARVDLEQCVLLAEIICGIKYEPDDE